MKAPKLIGTKQVAEYLNISPRTVLRLRRANLLPKPYIDRDKCPKWKRGDIVRVRKG